MHENTPKPGVLFSAPSCTCRGRHHRLRVHGTRRQLQWRHVDRSSGHRCAQTSLFSFCTDATGSKRGGYLLLYIPHLQTYDNGNTLGQQVQRYALSIYIFLDDTIGRVQLTPSTLHLRMPSPTTRAWWRCVDRDSGHKGVPTHLCILFLFWHDWQQTEGVQPSPLYTLPTNVVADYVYTVWRQHVDRDSGASVCCLVLLSVALCS